MTACPGCRREIEEKTSRCPHCRLDLVTYFGYHELLGDLGTLHNKMLCFERHLRETGVVPPQTAAEVKPPGVETPSPRATPQVPPQVPMENLAAPVPPRAPRTPPPSPPPPPRARSPQEMIVGQRWLLVTGVILTLFGLGYFLKYSFDQNWVGPWGRVAMGYLWGLVFLGIGEIARRKRFDTFGLYLLGGGIGIFYLSTFASFQIYHLLPQAAALALMTLATVFAGVLALIYDKLGLAILGLVGGFGTPLLLSTGVANEIGLMTYITILDAGVIGIAFFKRWRALNFLGFIFTWMLFAGFCSKYYRPDDFLLTLGFANLFFLTYAVAPFLYFFVQASEASVSGFAITIPNAFLGLGYSSWLIRSRFSEYEVSLVTVAYAALFLGLARYLYARNPKNREAIALLLGKAILFLVITVPILFSGHVITILWAAQAATLLWTGVRLSNRWLVKASFAVLGLCLVNYFFYDWPSLFRFDPDSFRYGTGFFKGIGSRLVTTASVLLSLFQMFRLAGRPVFGIRRRETSAVIASLFGTTLFLALNAEIVTFFSETYPDATFASVSVLWTVFSVGLLGLGFARKRASLRKLALLLFAATVFKVMGWDMANVSTPFRVISFVVLGLMLIGASYLYYRFKDRIAPSGETNEKAA